MTYLPTLLLVAPPREGGNGAIIFLVQMVIFVGIFYLLLIRPQQKQAKQRQAMIDAVKKGDEVVTNGGIVGRVVSTSEHRVTVETAGSKVEVDRLGIARVVDGSEEAARR